MSLQLAAKHLAAHGRGKDKMLVHMDKGEVDSLQKIAMANGGSLTINPHTGLPEAGFLSAMLPMIAGAGLMLIPGMQASAAGLIVGGLRTAQSGSLKKGIMAGLGAYGGAGLAGSAGAAGAGATNAANASANTIPQYGPSFTDAQSFDPSVLNAPPTPPVTGPITPSASMPDAYQDFGGKTGFETSSMPTTSGGMNVTAPTPPNGGISQYGPSYTDGQSVGYPAGTQPPTIPKSFEGMNAADRASSIKSGASFENAGKFIADNKYTAAGAAAQVASDMKKDYVKPEPDRDMGQRYSFTGGKLEPTPAPDVPSYEDMLTKQGNFGRQRQYFNSPTYSPISKDEAKDLYHFADGGPVEQMSNNAAMGANTMYPMANMATSSFATPYQDPRSTNMMQDMTPSGGGVVNMMSGEPNMQGTRMAEGGEAEGAAAESRPSYTYDAQTQKYTGGPAISGDAPQEGLLSLRRSEHLEEQQDANPGLGYTYNPQSRQYQQMASGGISDAGYNLGGYSDGGRLLRGPGDGVSDSIPAVIGKKQPARLADGEFVVPARIVSELGNGSTEAGARKLYAMMDRIQSARKKTVGKDKVAHNSRSSKYLPA